MALFTWYLSFNVGGLGVCVQLGLLNRAPVSGPSSTAALRRLTGQLRAPRESARETGTIKVGPR